MPLVLAGLAACAQLPQQADERQADEEVRMRGHALRTDSGLAFHACDAESLQSLRDGTPEKRLEGLMNELGQGEEDRTFIEIRARPRAEGLKLVALEHAAHETVGCAEERDFLWKASGNEPFWSFRIGPSETRVSRLAADTEEWSFSTPSPQVRGYLWRYRPGQANGREVVLELRRNPCRDSMAGHYFAYSAVLQVGEDRLTGCARAGAALADSDLAARP